MALSHLALLLVTALVQPGSGDALWVRQCNGAGKREDRPTGILRDSKGNFIVTGYSFKQETDFNFMILKYSPGGKLVWQRFYNSPLSSEDRVWASGLDARDNIYVTGGSISNPLHNWDYVTARYDPDGKLAWMSRYDSPYHGEDKPSAIALDDSGNVYVTGASRNLDELWDFLTVRYSPKGETVWTRRFRGEVRGNNRATAIAIAPNGNVLVGGVSDNRQKVPDMALVVYGRAGDLLWSQTLGGDAVGSCDVRAVRITGQGEVYVGGTVFNSGSGYDCALAKFSPDGKLLWLQAYDGPGHQVDRAVDVRLDSHGDVYVLGQSMGAGTLYDYLLIKYGPDGNSRWLRRYDGPPGNEDRATALAVGDSDNVFISGGSVQRKPIESFLTLSYDSIGNLRWLRSYAPAQAGDTRATAITERDGVVGVTGYSVDLVGRTSVITVVYKE